MISDEIDERAIDRACDEEGVELVNARDIPREPTRLVRLRSAIPERTQPKIESLQMRTTSDVRALLDRAAVDLYNGVLSPGRSRALAELARLALALHESEDLEREIRVLRDLIDAVPEAKRLLLAHGRKLRVL